METDGSVTFLTQEFRSRGAAAVPTRGPCPPKSTWGQAHAGTPTARGGRAPGGVGRGESGASRLAGGL